MKFQNPKKATIALGVILYLIIVGFAIATLAQTLFPSLSLWVVVLIVPVAAAVEHGCIVLLPRRFDNAVGLLAMANLGASGAWLGRFLFPSFPFWALLLVGALGFMALIAIVKRL